MFSSSASSIVLLTTFLRPNLCSLSLLDSGFDGVPPLRPAIPIPQPEHASLVVGQVTGVVADLILVGARDVLAQHVLVHGADNLVET